MVRVIWNHIRLILIYSFCCHILNRHTLVQILFQSDLFGLFMLFILYLKICFFSQIYAEKPRNLQLFLYFELDLFGSNFYLKAIHVLLATNWLKNSQKNCLNRFWWWDSNQWEHVLLFVILKFQGQMHHLNYPPPVEKLFTITSSLNENPLSF